MDEAAQGIASAALTLQFVLLQALSRRGVLSRDDALGIVDRDLEAAANVPSAEEADDVAKITQGSLMGVRERLAAMPVRQ